MAAAFGLGLATVSTVGAGDKVLDTRYPRPSRDAGELASLCDALAVEATAGTHVLTVEDVTRAASSSPSLGALAVAGAAPVIGRTRRVAVLTIIDDLADSPVDTHDAYLRLHLISARLVRPHGCSLDGLFGLLNNVVWTDLGPFDPDGFEDERMSLLAAGTPVTVLGIDKFPQMTDYVIPSGVRVANASRVRLGAYLGDGTTVMHEGFVNFNAGTEGPAMVEGRISAGVFVGASSDVGGGASIMGTLSGGGKEVVSIGSHCLLGANSGLGISLGDNCVVEAGLYVTAGTRVTLPDGTVCKAGRLSGRSDMLFRRNSLSGAVEMLPQSADWGGLNTDLHSND